MSNLPLERLFVVGRFCRSNGLGDFSELAGISLTIITQKLTIESMKAGNNVFCA